MPTLYGFIREMERAAKRAAREQAYQEKQLAKAETFEKVNNVVELYQNLLTTVTTLHKDCCDSINWTYLSQGEPPKEILENDHFEAIAKEKKQEYHPSLITKFFRRTEKKLSDLDLEIQQAIEKDNQIYKDQVKEYEDKLAKWKKEKDLALRILNGEGEAFGEVLESQLSIKKNPYIGERIDFHFSDEKPPVFELLIHPINEIIPTYILKQLKSGALSKREMPKSKRYLLYKEYVCSAVIILSREIFALLPLETITINAKCNQLNGMTGFMEEVIILSIFIPKETLDSINLQLIEPSIAIDNFSYNMDFKTLSGFNSVSQITTPNLDK
ncbi:MAG: hypothetical protein PWQ55_1974 [Chloroflexota bacterium]|nr:hypothetical protein [Chloroflexota bacterium]